MTHSTAERPKIFVSYSHVDANLVGPVVALLRASEALVFRDADLLQPGQKWRPQLEVAITESRILVVFWCRHALESTEVRSEWAAAIAQGKDVLPLLIDDTPLPEQLADYQGIDFRAAFPHRHGPEGYVAAPPPAGRSRRLPVIAAVGALAIGVASFSFLGLQPRHAVTSLEPSPGVAIAPTAELSRGPDIAVAASPGLAPAPSLAASAPVDPPVKASAAPGAPASNFVFKFGLLAVLAIVCGVAFAVARPTRRANKAVSTGKLGATPHERDLAATIESEIIRRIL